MKVKRRVSNISLMFGDGIEYKMWNLMWVHAPHHNNVDSTAFVLDSWRDMRSIFTFIIQVE